MFIGTRRVPLEVHPAFLAAHQAGYRVALLTPSAPRCSADLLSDVEVVDIFDRPAALKAAGDLAARSSAVGVVAWTDIGVEIASAVARQHGWPGVSAEGAHNARNKHSMRAAMRQHPDLIPRFRHVRTLDELVDAHRSIGTPAVLKPAGGSGSRSILHVHDDTDLAALFAEARRLTTADVSPLFADYDGEFVYEERLGGTEHSVEGLVHNGVLHIAGITDKWVTDPHYVEYEQVHPTVLPEPVRQRAAALAHTAVAALGLDSCAIHLELRALPDGSVKMLEVAARPGGNYITSHLVPLSTGVDFHANLIRVATGQAPDLTPTRSLFAGSRQALSPVEGRFGGFTGVGEALQLWGMEHFVYEREVGGRVVLPPGDALSAVLGTAIARSPSYDDVRRVLRQAVEIAAPTVTAE